MDNFRTAAARQLAQTDPVAAEIIRRFVAAVEAQPISDELAEVIRRALPPVPPTADAL